MSVHEACSAVFSPKGQVPHRGLGKPTYTYIQHSIWDRRVVCSRQRRSNCNSNHRSSSSCGGLWASCKASVRHLRVSENKGSLARSPSIKDPTVGGEKVVAGRKLVADLTPLQHHRTAAAEAAAGGKAAGIRMFQNS